MECCSRCIIYAAQLSGIKQTSWASPNVCDIWVSILRRNQIWYSEIRSYENTSHRPPWSRVQFKDEHLFCIWFESLKLNLLDFLHQNQFILQLARLINWPSLLSFFSGYSEPNHFQHFTTPITCIDSDQCGSVRWDLIRLKNKGELKRKVEVSARRGRV